MGANPPGRISPDGLWWWDGAQWRSAISPDGRWRWNGQAWEPYHAVQPRAGGGGGTATAVIVTILAFGGVIVLVSVLVIVVLLTMGNHIANVFSNVVAALGATPSP